MIPYSDARFISYPLTESKVEAYTDTLMKSVFVDAKLNLYGRFSKLSKFKVESIKVAKSTNVQFYTCTFEFSLTTYPNKDTENIARFNFVFDSNSSFRNDLYVRADFDSASAGYSGSLDCEFDGYVAFNKLSDLFILIKASNPATPTGNTSTADSVPVSEVTSLVASPATERITLINREFIPTVINHIDSVSVGSIQVYNGYPLITGNQAYLLEGSVQGNVTFEAGLNCGLFLNTATNTLTISAQRNANRSSTETCGLWSDKVSEEDTLCNEVFYALAGAIPDDKGNLKIKTSYPLSITSDGNTNTIKIGLLADKSNTNIFNCNT